MKKIIREIQVSGDTDIFKNLAQVLLPATTDFQSVFVLHAIEFISKNSRLYYMKLIIARHAETDENANEIIIGQRIDVALNEEGTKQAKLLADVLKHEKIDFAYVSPKKRAHDTADEVLKFHPNAKKVTAPHLEEQNLGIYEKLGKAEWKAIKKASQEPFELFKPPEGESYTEVQARVKKFFHDLEEKHAKDTVFLVSHGGTLGMLYLHLFDKALTEENYRAHKPENTALTILEIDKGQPIKVHKLNSLEHLT